MSTLMVLQGQLLMAIADLQHAVAPLASAAGGILAQIDDPGVDTDFPGNATAVKLLGNLKWLALAGCLGALFAGGGLWGWSTYQGGTSTGGRRAAIGGAIGAIVVGLGASIVNTFSAVT